MAEIPIQPLSHPTQGVVQEKGRSLILCFDGTNNQFGQTNTNIVRIVQVMDRDHKKQRVYYDPGVGTLPEPTQTTHLGKKVSEAFGLAFGLGISRKVAQAYSFLMNTWEPGDRVFLFGFSRGAHTARVLAGMLHVVGLLPKGCENMVPYAMRIYRAMLPIDDTDEDQKRKSWSRLCDQFRWSFAKQITKTDDDRRFPIHFLGLFDTVSTVGWLWNPVRFEFTNGNPSVEVVRHALAIDERRAFFNEDLFEGEGNQDVIELWFPGVHSDVGGGYPTGELWKAPFIWMIAEAEKAGFIKQATRFESIVSCEAGASDYSRHESLKGIWWLAEYFPKIVDGKVRLGGGRNRDIPRNAMLAPATQTLMEKDSTYRPLNIIGGDRDT